MPMSAENHLQKTLDNAEAQMRKGVLEFAILLVIAKRKTYANEIIESLKDVQLTVVEGTIYPLLSRLKNADLLTYDWEESKAGPPRKYYSLTAKGERFLTSCKEQWQNLEHAIHQLQNT
ncbi:MAG: PadR family transcriptional regulator [Candidatus Uhrbacteria bacterium]|nr:PadR family transcriptional regulator [Candidatus Uhrbacteria bacterium]